MHRRRCRRRPGRRATGGEGEGSGGGRAGSVVVFDLSEASDATLEGFTVTNGLAAHGGGMCDEGYT